MIWSYLQSIERDLNKDLHLRKIQLVPIKFPIKKKRLNLN